jgi:hypothetical protein
MNFDGGFSLKSHQSNNLIYDILDLVKDNTGTTA